MTYYWWNSHWSNIRKPYKHKYMKLPSKPLMHKVPPKQADSEKGESQMLLKAEGTGSFELAPARTHIGRCWMIADLGTQKSVYNGETKLNRKILFSWELPGAKMEDGRPFVVSERFTASIHEKAKLRSVLESWLGRAFTPEEEAGFSPQYFLGRPCMIGVVHETSKTGKTYANVSSVLQMPEGVDGPMVVNPPIYFSLDEYDQQDFERLPEWVRKVIMESPEYQVISQAKAEAPDLNEAPWEDDIAF